MLEPVFVGGTTVTRATLANQEVIRARDVRIGDTVLVRRAGDVIPFVAGVLDASKRTGASSEIVRRRSARRAATDLTEQGNSRELYCTNVACPAQTVRRLIHWASRAAADIDAIGQKWIERLNEAGQARPRVGLLRARQGDAARVRAHRRGLAANMIDSIERSKGVGLRKALIGFAIPMASEGTASRLCRAGYRASRRSPTRREEELQQVEDVGPKVAASLHEHLNRGHARGDRALRERGVTSTCSTRTSRRRSSAGAPLEGKTVVITGAIADPRSGEKVPRPVFQRLREGGRDDRLLGLGQHRHADHRRRRRREQAHQGGEARGRGRRPGRDLEAADRRRRGL